MFSIFLSHTSIDKPFVEKLAKDLQRIGVNVWYDKWEIKPGDSLIWKIEEGIKENSYLGIVLTPESLNSEWVKSELGAAWVKQMNTRKVVVIPILYRNCTIPLFLSDRKYADFREDYHHGFTELSQVFGIKETDTISISNWRKFTKYRNVHWKTFREYEFGSLVTRLIDRAKEYNWSSKVGASKNRHSITFYTACNNRPRKYVSIRLDGKNSSYLASLKNEWNPNNLKATDYTVYIGNTINECEEFFWGVFEEYKASFGNPEKSEGHDTFIFLNTDQKIDAIKRILKEFHWYKGD